MVGLFRFGTGVLSLVLVCCLTACTQGGNASSNSNTVRSSASSNALTLTAFKIGPTGSSYAELYSGIYYSKLNQILVTGKCSGNVKKIQMNIAANNGINSSDNANCSNGTFTWNKTFALEMSHLIEFVPQDQDGKKISDLSSLIKTVVFDKTPPEAPTFTLPTSSEQYTITDATSRLLIKGQVTKEIKKMVGPNSLNLALAPDQDGIHLNFMYYANITIGGTIPFTFTAMDGAGNASIKTMTINSLIDVSVPVTAQEIGSSTVTSNGITIQSTAGFLSGSSINSNVKNVTGSAGIIGNL